MGFSSNHNAMPKICLLVLLAIVTAASLGSFAWAAPQQHPLRQSVPTKTSLPEEDGTPLPTNTLRTRDTPTPIPTATPVPVVEIDEPGGSAPLLVGGIVAVVLIAGGIGAAIVRKKKA